MIEFRKLQPGDKDRYAEYLKQGAHRGCSYGFTNLFLWGRQRAAIVQEHLALFSHFDGHSMYPFPMGEGEVKPVLDAIIADSRQRGIPCRITGMTAREKALLEQTYPGQFRYHCDRDSFDYVYDINDLADLKGRKFQQKRNHVNKFETAFPDWEVRPLDESNLEECRALTDRWYRRRQEEDPHLDLLMEQEALRRAYSHYRELELDALTLYAGGRMVAMTMGSVLSEDTMDVHFEKADVDIPGAYAAVNRAFARFVREKYPHIRFLNREDDTGKPGIRQAKLSYHPHHMVEKCWALLMAEEYDDYV